MSLEFDVSLVWRTMKDEENEYEYDDKDLVDLKAEIKTLYKN